MMRKEKSSLIITRSYRAVCALIERSYSGRADLHHHSRSICICRTNPLRNLLAELSAGGFVGETAEAGENGVDDIILRFNPQLIIRRSFVIGVR